MQNTENEKLNWEAPIIIKIDIENTEVGLNSFVTEGGHASLTTPGSAS